MKVTVGEETYGWGRDARELPNDPEAYGPRILSPTEAAELAKAILLAGWKPFTKIVLEERRVFQIDREGKWRRAVSLKAMPGQILQVKKDVRQVVGINDEASAEQLLGVE